MTQSDWNPAVYARYQDLRLRPAEDLAARVPQLPSAGAVFDLGCGSGAVGPLLRARFGKHRLIGADSSPAMLDKARETGAYDGLTQMDIADCAPTEPPALIFSNAVLHWLPDHAALLPRLVGLLAPGGTLAVQVPHQNNAPSHRLWMGLADELFPGRIDHSAQPGVLLPAEYYRLLSPLGDFDLWETEYYQPLQPSDQGHPVRRFTEATFARPILDALTPGEQERLISAYEASIDKAYPAGLDGSVLFPLRRMFFTLTRSA